MNIILIIIDTLRYDYIGANGNSGIVTPHLDRLSSSSWNFDRAFAGSYPTIPMRKDLITGKYGAPFYPWSPNPHGAATFLDHLHDAGYVSQLIHDTPHLVSGGHNIDFPFMARLSINGAEVDHPWITGEYTMLDNWSFDPDLDGYLDRDMGTITEAYQCLKAYVPANCRRKAYEDWNVARLFDTASWFLRDNKKRDNFFLWVDCFDPHEPWDAPPDFVRIYDKTAGYDGTIDPRLFALRNMPEPGLPAEQDERIKAHYAAKVTFMDAQLGRFLDTLAETGLDKRTAVVLTADHGTNVGDGHYSKFGKGNPPLQNEAHVPLMISAPDLGVGRTSAISQPQDLHATILELAAVTAPKAEIDGIGLVDIIRNGGRGKRDIALTGTSIDQWANLREDTKALFGASSRHWNLGVHPNVEKCVLEKMGEPGRNVASEYPDVVKDLHTAAIGEIVRRGLPEKPADWLRGGGRGVLDPEDVRRTDSHAFPPGFESHWEKIFRRKN